MPAPKPTESNAPKAAQPAAREVGRKPWKKKSPIDIVLEQATKLRSEIAKEEAELNAKKQQLKQLEDFGKSIGQK